jgi:2-polyprenyl-3-methyl-5-hydroxy-6-metoxy-1,4-benzoquinol methylase
MESIEILKKYFSIPYDGHVFIFNSKVTLEDLQQHSFTDILSHKNALRGHSIAMSIFNSIFTCADGLDGKQILDVGGNTGYFSFLATESGANATMIERDNRQATVAKAMAEVRDLKVNIVNDSIQNYLESSENKFDCALMLNMFDQMLRTDEESAWKTLRQISERCKMLFLMMGPTEQMPTVKGLVTSTPLNATPAKTRHYKPDYEVIMEKTIYTKYEVLATHIYGDRQLQAYWRIS